MEMEIIKMYGFAKDVEIKFDDGRSIPLEGLVRKYEWLLKEKSSVLKPKVGEWFPINREVINQNREEIRKKCYEAGVKGKVLFDSFEKTDQIANERPEKYPYKMETYVFEHRWEYLKEKDMRRICCYLGNGMCDEVICNFELQMRICNGELVRDLLEKEDDLPLSREIRCLDGKTGYWGGGALFKLGYPPSRLSKHIYEPNRRDYRSTPYAFREKNKQC